MHERTQHNAQLRRGLKKLAVGQEVALFRQTAATFRRRKLWVLKSSILPPNSGETERFTVPNLVFLKEKFRGGVANAPAPCGDDATDNALC